jgi:hypothetical protein
MGPLEHIRWGSQHCSAWQSKAWRVLCPLSNVLLLLAQLPALQRPGNRVLVPKLERAVELAQLLAISVSPSLCLNRDDGARPQWRCSALPGLGLPVAT